MDRASRKKLAKDMAQLEASTRQIAKALGVSHMTAQRELTDEDVAVTNVPETRPESMQEAVLVEEPVTSVTATSQEPVTSAEWFQRDDKDVVKHAQKAAKKEQAAAATQSKRESSTGR